MLQSYECTLIKGVNEAFLIVKYRLSHYFFKNYLKKWENLKKNKIANCLVFRSVYNWASNSKGQ